MAIEWDDGWDGDHTTWYCTVCDAELEHGDYDVCPKCGK